MAEASLKLGGDWGVKEGSLLGFNDENGNYKPIPFDFTRATTATRVNRDGLIEEVQSGVPRIDFLDNPDGALKLEPQRTNLVTQSETFTNYWGFQGSTKIEDNNVKNPTGNNFSNIIESASTGNYKGLTKSESSSWDNKTLSVSCFAKKITTDYIFFYNIGSTSGTNGVWFNIGNGTIGEIGDGWSNPKIEDYGNGWYRCSAKITFGSNTNYLYILNSDGDNNATSTIGSRTYIWGTQIEEGGYLTSYIPTSGSAVTRNADACNNTSASSHIGQTEGSVYVEVNISNTTNKTILALDSGSASNFIILDTNSSLNPQIKVRQSSGSFPSIITGTAMNYGINKIAFCYKSGDYAMYVNGVLSGTSTSTTFPSGTISKISVGANPSYGYLSDAVYDIKLYKTRLTNEELAALTTI